MVILEFLTLHIYKHAVIYLFFFITKKKEVQDTANEPDIIKSLVIHSRNIGCHVFAIISKEMHNLVN